MIRSSTACICSCVSLFRTGIRMRLSGWRTLIISFLRSECTSEEIVCALLHLCLQVVHRFGLLQPAGNRPGAPILLHSLPANAVQVAVQVVRVERGDRDYQLGNGFQAGIKRLVSCLLVGVVFAPARSVSGSGVHTSCSGRRW